MPRRLINVFRMHYKYYGNNDWMDLVSDHYLLDEMTERFGDSLYNKTILHLASIDEIGAAIVPFLAITTQVNFSYFKDGDLVPQPDPKLHTALFCEQVTEENYQKIMELSEKYNIVLIGSLIKLNDNYKLPMRHIYLYDRDKLEY